MNAPQQAPKEYICNAAEQIRSQAKALSNIITLEPNTAKELTHIEGELWEIANKMDYPHPTSSSDEAISGLISENARIGAELRRAQQEIQKLNGEHDAAIRAEAARQAREEEREKVLEELRKLCMNDESVGCTVFRHIQSLRGSQ